jgi:hypothetical protein
VIGESGGPTSDALVRAVEAVADAVRRSRNIDPARAAAAVEEIASVTQHHGEASVEKALATIRGAMIKPLDPSALTWNAFRFFEIVDREVYWTKWLASMISPDNGRALSRLVWRAICDSVVEQGCEPAIYNECERDVLATLDDWAAEHDQLPYKAVGREVHDPDLGEAGESRAGRVDIAIAAANMFVVIENKIDAWWHDGEIKQAALYRKFGLKRLKNGQKLGLVLLTKDPDFTLEQFCKDYVRITYWDLARNLRRGLRRLAVDASSAEWWPALLTIAAIEQDLCGLDINGILTKPTSWRVLEHATKIADYLREPEEHR